VFLPARPRIEEAQLGDLEGLIVGTAEGLPPKRRRDIVGVTLQLLADAGFSSLTFSGIASRSGIATATIERVWSSKQDLVIDALRETLMLRPIPDTGSFAGDCDAFLTDLTTTMSDPRIVPVIAGLVGESARDPALAKLLRARLLEPRRAAIHTMIARGISRGELPPDTSVDLLSDVLIAPVFHRLLITGEPVTPELGHQLASAITHRLAPAQPEASGGAG
jgi:AcrR family transcriptional regulator